MTPVVADLFTRAVASVSVNRTIVANGSVEKIRRRGAGAIIRLGNAYFRRAEACFEMFASTEEWIAWEAHMYERLHGLTLRRLPRGFVAPLLPGLDLATLLDRGELSDLACAAAARAIREIHGRGLSHGDANLGNYLFDGSSARAIDFDARHRAEASIENRVVDDLLAFVIDLLGRADDAGGWERAAMAFLDAYAPSPSTLLALGAAAAQNGFFASTLLRARAHGVSLARIDARWSRLATHLFVS